MLHCDADTLALVSLGEPAADDERRHLASCVRCQSELDQNKAVVASGRSVVAEDAPTEPPPQVWQAISSELGLRPDLVPFVPEPGDRSERAEVIALAEYRQRRRAERRRTTWVGVAASAVGIALGGVAMTAITAEDPGTVIAESRLSVVPIDAGGSPSAPDDVSGTAASWIPTGRTTRWWTLEGFPTGMATTRSGSSSPTCPA